MKKLLNIFAVVSLFVVLLASCNTEKINPIYTPDAAGYSFTAKASSFTLPATDPVFSIKVFRNTGRIRYSNSYFAGIPTYFQYLPL